MGSRKYGRAWKRIRDKYIKEHPLCEKCLEKTDTNPEHIIQLATEVHHIIPICKGGTHDRNNLMAVCTKCHTEIHMEDNR